MVKCSLCKSVGHNRRSCKQQICSICLDYVPNINTTTLECGHTFHTSCCLKWLQYNNVCPFCRTINKNSFPILNNEVVEDILTENIYIKNIILDTINFHQTFILYPWLFAVDEEKTDEEKKEIWNGYSKDLQARLISLIISNVVINTSREYGLSILDDVKTYQENNKFP